MAMSESAAHFGSTTGSPAPLTAYPVDFVIRQVKAYRFTAPVRPPIRSSFGPVHERSCLLVSLQDEDGVQGWGEIWSGMPAFGVNHRYDLLTRIAAPLLIGQRVRHIGRITDTLHLGLLPIERLAGEPGPVAQVIAGIDCAMWDLAAKRSGVPLYQFLGGLDPAMATYASGVSPDIDAGAMDRLRGQGYRAFKFKAGFDDARTLKQLHRLGHGLQPAESMMIDANCGWTVDQAKNAFQALAECPLEWIEEPVGPEVTAREWKELAAMARQPLAGGENLRSSEQFEAAFDWLGVIQPDLGKWGGISGVLPLARQAIAQGKRYCPHSFGSFVSAALAAHVLAAVGGNGRLEIDANANPLRTLSAADFPPVREGLLTLGNAPGIGIEVDLRALQAQCGVA